MRWLRLLFPVLFPVLAPVPRAGAVRPTGKQRVAPALLAAICGLGLLAAPATAAGPRNPYSSFNLSGINWGAQQWERDQRAGRVVWPYYNVPGRSGSGTVRSGGGYVGGGTVAGGTVGVVRQSPRGVRRWRR